MIRIWTFLTLVAGEPTVAGTYFDPEIADLDVDMGSNQLVIPIRDGTEAMIADPQSHFENRGMLMYSSSHVDEKSLVQYLAADRFLSTVLYHHYRNHLPIAIFISNLTGAPKKCYVGKLLSAERTIASIAVEDTTQRIFHERHNTPSILNWPFKINLDGIYTDVDDITSGLWSVRE